MKTYKRVLTIAGSDSGGGAGIQADLKTFSALGCYGMSVITALTAQNTRTVTGIYPVLPEFIRLQIDAVVQDIGVDAVKIGMLHSPAVIEAVADRLKAYQIAPIVLDPVMVAKGGARLLQEDAIEALRTILLPLATIVTPNLPEAFVLAGRSVPEPLEVPTSLEALAREIACLGPAAVLVKGGHLTGRESSDVLYMKKTDTVVTLEAPRIETRNTHGTGCTLSSAIAAFLARGAGLADAVQSAKTYVTEALQAGADYRLGEGQGPVHHFYRFWA